MGGEPTGGGTGGEETTGKRWVLTGGNLATEESMTTTLPARPA
jgi:hypothetical protein